MIVSITFNYSHKTIELDFGGGHIVAFDESKASDYINDDPNQRTFSERLEDARAIGWPVPT